MRGSLLFILLLGCATEDVGDGRTPAAPDPLREVGEPDDTVATPRECDLHVPLYGMTGSSAPTPVGPLVLDTEGVAICLELDARDNLQVAHFAAGTDREHGATASSFAVALYDPDGNLVRQGHDVTFGTTPPNSFASVEAGFAPGQVHLALLHVRAKAGSAMSEIDLRLFEPFE